MHYRFMQYYFASISYLSVTKYTQPSLYGYNIESQRISLGRWKCGMNRQDTGSNMSCFDAALKINRFQRKREIASNNNKQTAGKWDASPDKNTVSEIRFFDAAPKWNDADV